MQVVSRKELEKNYRMVKLLRDTPGYKIELVERISDKTKLIKRTYFEDKREIFSLLMKADIPYVIHLKVMLFDTDTIILEEYIEGQTQRFSPDRKPPPFCY